MDVEVFAFTSARAVILTKNYTFIFSEQYVTRITLGQYAHHLNNTRLTVLGNTKVFRVTDDDIREVGSVKVSAFAFNVNGTGLLHHTVVIVNILHLDTAHVIQTLLKLGSRDRLCYQFLPATTMDENTLGKVGLVTALQQLLIEVLPNHEGKAKEEDGFILMLLQEGFHSFYIQFHVFIQSIHTFAAKHRETKNTSAPSREHIAVFYHIAGIKDNHGHTLVAQQRGNNLGESLGLVGRSLTVQINLGSFLASGT